MPDMSYPVAGGATLPGYLAVPQTPVPQTPVPPTPVPPPAVPPTPVPPPAVPATPVPPPAVPAAQVPAAQGPATAGPWPGVVVIHEAFGLNDDIRKKADQLAAHGYLALAPDLYGGRHWSRCVRAAIGQLAAGSGPAFDALEAARGFLAARGDCTGRTGVIGFCLGGGFALLCAPKGGFDAASVNYGQVPQDAEAALRGACPIVGSFGARDRGGTKPAERLQRALVVLDVPHDVKVYPGSGHRFMTETSGAAGVLARFARMSYQEADAQDAWERIYRFFSEHLRASATV